MPSITEIFVDCLTIREQEVMNQRFGLNLQQAATLKDIGARMLLTRERVRQIEAAAIRKLRRRKHAEFQQYLGQMSDDACSAIWGKSGWVSQEQFRVELSSLKAEIVLAVVVVHESFDSWARTVAINFRGGWLLRSVDKRLLLDTSEHLEDYLRNHPLPVHVQHVAAALHRDLELLTIAAATSKLSRLYEGFICGQTIGARTRRAIYLVRRLASAGRGVPITIEALCTEPHASAAAADRGGYRDLQIALGQNRHLFVNMYEEGWATCAPPLDPIGADAAARVLSKAAESDNPAPTDASTDVGTVRGFLARLLATEGPMTIGEMRTIVETLPKRPFAIASVGPILISNEEFIRLAPGIYWLRTAWTQTGEMHPRLVKLLLTEKQFTLYCQARRAGENERLYPAWSSDMKIEWARWAFRGDRKDLLGSLLNVTEPSEWPAGQVEVRAWRERVGARPIYSLSEPLSVPLDETLPTPEQFLSASLWARHRGQLSWISANRVTGNRADDRHAASLLALLCVCGVIHPADHWQDRHVYDPGSDSLILACLDHTFDSRPGWPRCLTELLSNPPSDRMSTGWLSTQDVSSLLGSVRTRSQEKVASDVAPDEVSTDDLLDELKADLTSQKLTALLGG
jgi:hypothetical protein